MKALGPDLRVTEGALAQIVLRAAEGVDGAQVRRPRRKVSVEIEGSHARVSLELAVAYGRVVPDVARGVQREVADAHLLTGRRHPPAVEEQARVGEQSGPRPQLGRVHVFPGAAVGIRLRRQMRD